jgi:RimJ/RimL family protein N-acetyltransferase
MMVYIKAEKAPPLIGTRDAVVRLKGERVVIRPLRIDELDRMLSGRIEIAKEIQPSRVPEREQLRARIGQSGSFHNGRIDLGIEVNGRLVGDIQTYRPPNRSLPPAVFEIGVGLYDRANRGKGLGAEAIRLFVDWLFRQGAELVQGATTERNRPMCRAFERLGFTILGKVDISGIEQLLYGVSRSEWQGPGDDPSAPIPPTG